MPKFNKPAKKKHTGLRIVIGLVIIILRYMWAKSFSLDTEVKVLPGNTISTILKPLSSWNQKRLKVYIKTHHIDFSQLEPGTYEFSGSYTKSQFIETILAGPANKYIKITVLEGRSIYDIDASLTKKGLINQGEYIALVTDPTIIGKYQTKYDFLKGVTLHTLEGFLYPDTYNVDAGNNIVDQLAYLQLEAFNSKVRKVYQQQFPTTVQRGEYSTYDLITIASVVEKEEKNSKNKATVAGIFFNRLDNGIRLDADITLCYAFQKPYAECTPAIIAQNVDDMNNQYNTRVHAGLLPTPIANPSAETIAAVLNYERTSYMYYLHGSDGVIHYGKTLDEHNQNKNQYLK